MNTTGKALVGPTKSHLADIADVLKVLVIVRLSEPGFCHLNATPSRGCGRAGAKLATPDLGRERADAGPARRALVALNATPDPRALLGALLARAGLARDAARILAARLAVCLAHAGLARAVDRHGALGCAAQVLVARLAVRLARAGLARAIGRHDHAGLARALARQVSCHIDVEWGLGRLLKHLLGSLKTDGHGNFFLAIVIRSVADSKSKDTGKKTPNGDEGAVGEDVISATNEVPEKCRPPSHHSRCNLSSSE